MNNTRQPASNGGGRWAGKCQVFTRLAHGVPAVGDAIDVLRWAERNGKLHRDSNIPINAVALFGGASVAGTHIATHMGSGVLLGTSSDHALGAVPWDDYDSVGVFSIDQYSHRLPYVGWTDVMVGHQLTLGGVELFKGWQGGILREYGYKGPADNLPAFETYKAMQRKSREGGYVTRVDGKPGLHTFQQWEKLVGF
jgi:hypothetical protein